MEKRLELVARSFVLPLSLDPFPPFDLFYAEWARSLAAMAGFGCAPISRSTSFPFLKMSMVGSPHSKESAFRRLEALRSNMAESRNNNQDKSNEKAKE